MTLQSLNHVTIRPHNLDATRDFYVDIVGIGNTTDAYFGRAYTSGIGAVDHVAFTYDAEDYDKTCAAIEKLGFDCMRQTVPELGLRQLFIKDPDEVLVELNFPAE